MLPRILCLAGAVLLFSGPALAVPMDLRDLRPRWVGVEFEISPPAKPHQLRSVFSERVSAWFEPVPELGQVRITVDADAIERQLMAQENPKRGSFSDFVWIFDAATGEVVSATLTGTVLRRLDWGVTCREVEAEISAEMSSRSVAGFKPPLRVLGNVFHRFCSDGESSNCTLVEGRQYDFRSGYVNAVGKLKVGSSAINVRVFSPLGEAVFSEIEVPEGPPARTEAESFEFSELTSDPMVRASHVAAPPPRLN